MQQKGKMYEETEIERCNQYCHHHHHHLLQLTVARYW